MYLLWLEHLGTPDELEVFLDIYLIELSILQLVEQFVVSFLHLPILLLQLLDCDVLQVVQE